MKSYSEEIKQAMDELFRRQMQAYETIYDTDKDVILARMKGDKAAAEDLIANLDPETKKKFEDIQAIKKTTDRAQAIRELDDPEEYEDYAAAINKLATLKKLRLIERTECDEMHIKVVNGTAHYDEYSPHAHGVSVCWADGYSTGLSSRVAKSVVLNQWSLSVIQDKMRDIAKEFIQGHPEIFQGEFLAEKSQGRNWDYDTKEIIERNQKALLQKNQEVAEQITEAEKYRDEVSASTLKLVEVHRNARVAVARMQDKKVEIEEQLAIVQEFQNNPETYDNIEYLAVSCSGSVFERLDRMGRNMRQRDMQQNLFAAEIDRQIADAARSADNEHRLWDTWRRLSDDFKRKRRYRRWDPKCTDKRRAYYDAQYLFDTTSNIFVAAYALLKMVFSGYSKEADEVTGWLEGILKAFKELRERLEEIEAELIEEEFRQFDLDEAYNDVSDQYPFEEFLVSLEEKMADADRAVEMVDAAEKNFREKENFRHQFHTSKHI